MEALNIKIRGNSLTTNNMNTTAYEKSSFPNIDILVADSVYSTGYLYVTGGYISLIAPNNIEM